MMKKLILFLLWPFIWVSCQPALAEIKPMVVSWDAEGDTPPDFPATTTEPAKEFPKRACKEVWSKRQANKKYKGDMSLTINGVSTKLKELENNRITSFRAYHFPFTVFKPEREIMVPGGPQNGGGEIAVKTRAIHEDATKDEIEKPFRDYIAYRNEILRDPESPDQPMKREDCYKEWTILVAMDADSDLRSYALWDLYEMEATFNEFIKRRKDGNGFKKGDPYLDAFGLPQKRLKAGTTLHKDVLVQHIGPKGVRRLQIFQTEKPYTTMDRTYFDSIDINSVESPVMEVVSDQRIERTLESGKIRLGHFVDFVTKGMRNFPAKNYMVVLWGHGKGWLWNEVKDTVHLKGPELLEAVKRIHKNTNQPIDNFVADACYMQTIEMATELSPYVHYYSGSAQVQTFLGLPYRTIFDNMDTSKFHFNYVKKKLGENMKSLNRDGSINESLALAELLPLAMSSTVNYTACKKALDKARAEKGSDIQMEDLNLTFCGAQAKAELKTRIDDDIDDLQPSMEFFTYASLDLQKLRENFLPQLFKFSNALKMSLTEEELTISGNADKSQADFKEDVPYIIAELSNYRSEHVTRDLGAILGAFFGSQNNDGWLPESLGRKSHVGDEAKVTHKSLQETIVLNRFSETYKDEGFVGVGAWFPIKSYEFRNDFVEFNGNEERAGTLLYQYPVDGNPFGVEKMTSPWAEAIQSAFK